MDAARWERLTTVLDDALSADPELREALLDAALGDDAELRAEARSLLAQERAAVRLEPAPNSALAATLARATESDPWIGRCLGDWRLDSFLGQGGMARVYLAEPRVGSLRQRAAVKLLHATLSGGERARARFRAEQRLLARLEHPGIVRFIDGGVSEEGVPYLVMDYVEGATLDRYVREARLDLRARVALMREIGSAVQYAHQNLVVHRDIKPANVLVDGAGRPRLVDFGIAKLLAAPDDAGLATRTGERPRTPRYASPEQLRDGPLTTASDVYSLGVVLYELLCGVAPYELAGRSPAQVERAVCELVPERPSTALGRCVEPAALGLDLARLRRRLSGDLDTIVLRALAKDPARRYGTAGELADELGRWLGNLPVRARPDRWSYRVSRYVRRNRLAVGAGAAVLLSLALGLWASLHENRAARAAQQRERQARELAEERFAQTQDLVRSLVFGVHDRIERLPGATPVRRFVIETTREHLDRLRGVGSVPASLRDDLAATYMRLGAVQGARALGNQGDVAGALESTRSAAALLREALGATPEDPLLLDRCAAAQRQLGDLERLSDRAGVARAHYDEQLALCERGLDLDEDSVPLRRQVAIAWAQCAQLDLDAGDARAALAGFERALGLARELESQHPQESELARDLYLYEARRGGALLALGRLEEALGARMAAAERAEALSMEHPEDGQLALEAGFAAVEQAEVLRALGRVEQAEQLLRAGRVRIEQQVALDPENVLAASYLMQTVEGLGELARLRGDLALEQQCFEQAVAQAQHRLAASRGDAPAARDLARLWIKLADHQARVQQPAASRSSYESSLDMLDAANLEREPGDGELRFSAELGLTDLERAAGHGARARAGYEALLEQARAEALRSPDAAGPLRNRGLVGWRLGTLLEELAADASLPRDARVALLERARELYDEGLASALILRARNWLTPLEQSAVEGFEADLVRTEGALAELGPVSGF